MKINITSKGLNPAERTLQTIEKKIGKLDKYFAKDTVAYVVLKNEKNNTVKLEATINADGLIFRAEETGNDLIFCLDKVVDKLSSQMSRFKSRLVKKHKDQKEVLLSEIPDAAAASEDEEEMKVVKTKSFRITPMPVDEAIVQMELLNHNFYVFRDEDTNHVCVVYKRKDESYGMLNIEN